MRRLRPQCGRAVARRRGAELDHTDVLVIRMPPMLQRACDVQRHHGGDGVAADAREDGVAGPGRRGHRAEWRCRGWGGRRRRAKCRMMVASSDQPSLEAGWGARAPPHALLGQRHAGLGRMQAPQAGGDGTVTGGAVEVLVEVLGQGSQDEAGPAHLGSAALELACVERCGVQAAMQPKQVGHCQGCATSTPAS